MSNTHKMIARCMTRHNTSSQNATEPNAVHETSSTNSDVNAPNAQSDERHVVLSVCPNLSTCNVFHVTACNAATRSQVSCNFAKSVVPKYEMQHQTRDRVQSTTIIRIRASRETVHFQFMHIHFVK